MLSNRQIALNFSPEDEQYLRDNYGKIPIEDIAEHLQRSVPSIQGKAARMTLSANKTAKHYKAEIIHYARQGYTAQAIGEYLGIAPSKISYFCRKQGVSLSLYGSNNSKKSVILDENCI